MNVAIAIDWHTAIDSMRGKKMNCSMVCRSLAPNAMPFEWEYEFYFGRNDFCIFITSNANDSGKLRRPTTATMEDGNTTTKSDCMQRFLVGSSSYMIRQSYVVESSALLFRLGTEHMGKGATRFRHGKGWVTQGTINKLVSFLLRKIIGNSKLVGNCQNTEQTVFR